MAGKTKLKLKSFESGALILLTLLFTLSGCNRVKVEVADIPPSVDMASESIRNLKPVLAVRGSGCLTCHAQVQSNIVTDFGYGGDGKGRDYYFSQTLGARSPDSKEGPYGDATNGPTEGNWETLQLAAGRKIIVPSALLPSFVEPTRSNYRISEYLKDLQPKAEVIEATEIYIGAPTASRLKGAFNLLPTDGKLKFIKRHQDSFEFSGISLGSNQNYFTNSSPVVCEGDLFLDGTLFLKDLKLKTKSGCRIYVTESVFINGPIQYITGSEDDYAKRNLQIVSARSINLGLGAVEKEGVACDTKDITYNSSTGLKSSMIYRHQEYPDADIMFTRDSSTPQQLTDLILQDAAKVDQPIYDGNCTTGGRNIAFSRLLLNAPRVHSRYRGNFKGIVIAEFALISHGDFKFEFDPVFLEVNTLTQLQESDFLKITMPGGL